MKRSASEASLPRDWGRRLPAHLQLPPDWKQEARASSLQDFKTAAAFLAPVERISFEAWEGILKFLGRKEVAAVAATDFPQRL